MIVNRLRKKIATPPPEPVVLEAKPAENEAVPSFMVKTAGFAWRFLVIVAMLVIFGIIFKTFSMIIIALLVAFLLTALIEGPNRWMKRKGVPAALSAALTLLGFLAFVIGLVWASGNSVVSGFTDLKDRLVEGVDAVLAWVSNGPLNMEVENLSSYIDKVTETLSNNANLIAGGVFSVTGSILSVGTGLILALFCLFFFLKDGHKLWHYMLPIIPSESRHKVNESAVRAWKTLGDYTRTQVLIALIDAVGIALVALFLGVSLWLPIGALVFVGSFIPIVGAFLTGGVAALVALVELGPTEALIMVIGVLVVQQVEGNALQPFLQGNQLSLHPVVVVIAVAAGAGIAGIFGALFAVPIVAMINTVINYWNGRDMYPELQYDKNRAGGPPGTIYDVRAGKNEALAKRDAKAASKAGVDARGINPRH